MTSSTNDQRVVVDASAIVDFLVDTARASAVSDRINGHELLAPAHLDLEVLSAVARLIRAGEIDEQAGITAVSHLVEAPISRVPLAELAVGAWNRRGSLRVSDALCVELAEQLSCGLVTTDDWLARAVDWIEPIVG